MTDRDVIVAALEAGLRARFDDPTATVTSIEQLAGGASREIWALTLRTGGDEIELILRRNPPGDPDATSAAIEAEVMLAAGDAGVAVPVVYAIIETPDVSGLVLERVYGETVPRRILRSAANGAPGLARQCGEMLGRLHTMRPPPTLRHEDRLVSYRSRLDGLGHQRPVLEFAYRWLIEHRPPERRLGLVHGDFRLGNLVVDTDGLHSVLDWESAHTGDPLEDLGWLCVPAWRFGASLPVGGFGTVEDLLDGYVNAGAPAVPHDDLRWGIVLGTWVWAVGCLEQTERFRTGALRTVDLAAVGRRVTENEADLLDLIIPNPSAGVAEPAHPPEVASAEPDLFAPPSLSELLGAVRETLSDEVLPDSVGKLAYQVRVCISVLDIVQRELALAASVAEEVSAQNQRLGAADDSGVVDRIRSSAVPLDDPVLADVLRQRTNSLLRVNAPTRLTSD